MTLSLFLLCQHLQSLGSCGILKNSFSPKESQGNNNYHLMEFTVAQQHHYFSPPEFWTSWERQMGTKIPSLLLITENAAVNGGELGFLIMNKTLKLTFLPWQRQNEITAHGTEGPEQGRWILTAWHIYTGYMLPKTVRDKGSAPHPSIIFQIHSASSLRGKGMMWQKKS